MAMATLAAARRVAALGRFQSSNVSASALVPRRGFAGAADHHGPANVNCWSGNWKEEHFVIVSLAGWSTLIYGSYKFFTKGKKEEMYESGGFWYSAPIVDSVNAFRANFQPARDDVVVLASMPKAGTTWLKSLSHCILFHDVEEEDDLLTTTNPHNCVPTFESTLFVGEPSEFPAIDPESRLFHTHVPYNNLPDSIKNHSRGCKLVYVAREPKDTLVSAWHFYNKILRPFPIERAKASAVA
ncbi:Cytosolic sulfotransferase 5 [Linum perenne]